MLDSLTPQASSFSLAPVTRGSMMVSFQRAWTMAMRRAEPSWCWGEGPLSDDMIERWGFSGGECENWCDEAASFCERL